MFSCLSFYCTKVCKSRLGGCHKEIIMKRCNISSFHDYDYLVLTSQSCLLEEGARYKAPWKKWARQWQLQWLYSTGCLLPFTASPWKTFLFCRFYFVHSEATPLPYPLSHTCPFLRHTGSSTDLHPLTHIIIDKQINSHFHYEPRLELSLCSRFK